MKKDVYLDYAAATPVSNKVMRAMSPFLNKNFYNPSALYLHSVSVNQSLNDARKQVASIVGVKPAEIIFTAGGTEANNMALQGIARAYPGKHLIYSSIEHDSITKTAQWLHDNNYRTSEVAPKSDGIISPESVLKVISDDTVLVSIMYANNEMGAIQPIKEIAKLLQNVREERKSQNNKLPIYLHTDACQATNYLDIHLSRLGVDLMTLNGGKMYGPKQSGVLVKNRTVTLEPLMFGGGQEQNYRSGTENVPAIIGFSTALYEAQQLRHSESRRLYELQSCFIGELQKKYPVSIINGSLKNRLPNNIHITFPSHDNERLLFGLDQLGVQCATGSACSASNQDASHVLLAMGINDAQARSSLRFTMGRNTEKTQLQYVIESLSKLL